MRRILALTMLRRLWRVYARVSGLRYRYRQRRCGWALAKAADDPFDYAAGLVTGEVIRFSHCVLRGGWVELYSEGFSDDIGLTFPCPRGVTVRLGHIVWVADAPEGS